MTEREKVAHLLRRFGLGAGRYELEKYEPLGVKGTLDLLLDFEKVDERFTVSPWSFAVQADKKLYTDPYQIAGWWGLRFLMTQRPLQERLTLFWHDHFAASGEKVFEGPTMLEYNRTLRQHSTGKFRDLLKAICKQGALISYLDANTSTKLHPNENFAREVLELFTLGMGNYTEQDVREAARAFTGWSMHYSGIGDETPYEELAQRAARQGMSLFNFCVVPVHHDAGEKTFLGQKGKFDGDDILDMLAAHPATARHISKKLWQYFVGIEPTKSVLDQLTQAWKGSDGSIKQVLRTIAETPEFWSPAVVRSKPKSPVDYTVAMFRSFGLQDVLVSMVGKPTDEYEPVKEDLRKAGLGVFYLLSQQGLTLLFPPSVGGWEWGGAWITANNTVLRVNHSTLVFWGEDPNRPIAQLLAQKFKAAGQDTSAASIVDALLDVFDASVTTQERDVLTEACTRAGGPSRLGDKDGAASVFAEVTKLLFAVPSFQLC